MLLFWFFLQIVEAFFIRRLVNALSLCTVQHTLRVNYIVAVNTFGVANIVDVWRYIRKCKGSYIWKCKGIYVWKCKASSH